MLRHTKHLSRRHLDQRQHLATLRDQRGVLWTHDAECAPETRTVYAIQPGFDHQLVAKLCSAPIIDLCVDHHRVPLVLGHLHKREPKLLSKMCTRRLDTAQICDVRYNTSTIGIEEHYLHICANTRDHSRFHIFD